MIFMAAMLALALHSSPGVLQGQAPLQDTSRSGVLNRWVQKQAGDTAEQFAPVLPTNTALQTLSALDSTTAKAYLLADPAKGLAVTATERGATIEVPASHHGRSRPDRKNSPVLRPARLE